MPDTSGLTNPKAPRLMLVEALRTILVPEMTSLGFQRHKLPPVLGGRSGNRTAPFGQFRRPRGDATDLAAIGLDPTRPDTFDIAFGTLPAGDLPNRWGPTIPHDEVWVDWLPVGYRLLPSARFHRRFRVRRWPWSPPAGQADYDALVRRVAALLPEMETALGTGKTGRHVRLIDMREQSDG